MPRSLSYWASASLETPLYQTTIGKKSGLSQPAAAAALNCFQYSGPPSQGMRGRSSVVGLGAEVTAGGGGVEDADLSDEVLLGWEGFASIKTRAETRPTAATTAIMAADRAVRAFIISPFLIGVALPRSAIAQ